MSGSARVAALGASLLAAAVGVLTGAAVHASTGRIDTAAAGVPPSAEATAGSATSSPAATDQRVAAADAVITEEMADLVAGSLSRQVVVVALGSAAEPGAQTVAADLGAAGAVVRPTAVLLDGWIDESLRPLRSGLAAQLSQGEAAGVDGLDAVLARSLAGGGGTDAPTALAALAGAGLALVPPAVPDAAPAASPGEVPAGEVPEGEVPEGEVPEGEVPDIEAPAAATPPATLVVFVTTPGPDPGRAAWTQVISTWRSTAPTMDVLVAEYSVPVAQPPPAARPGAAGADDAAAAAAGSLVLGIRDGPLVALVSTVDTADSGLGRVSVVRSAARAARGAVGHYGFLEGASAAVAPVPTVDRTAELGG